MVKKVLFICTGNSARSIMAEALMNELGKGKYKAYSAGSNPSKNINPLTISVLNFKGHDAKALKTKSFEIFRNIRFDFVFTVCNNARESCPVWPGVEKMIHWDIEDPASFIGSEKEKFNFFGKTYNIIKSKIERFLSEHDTTQNKH